MPELEEKRSVVTAPAYGLVTMLPYRVLVDITERAMGDFVQRGASLFRVHGPLPEPRRSAAARSVILENERSHEFEPAFGVRKLSTWQGPQIDPPIGGCSSAIGCRSRYEDEQKRFSFGSRRA